MIDQYRSLDSMHIIINGQLYGFPELMCGNRINYLSETVDRFTIYKQLREA